MGQLPSAEQGKILWDILRKQENKCEVLADALVSNGEVRKISTDNSELIMTINIRMEVSYRFLFHLMIDRNLTAKAVSEMSGVSTAILARMRKGDCIVSGDVIDKLCKALDCSPNDIVEIRV